MISELYRFRPRYLTNTQTHEYILSIGSILSKTNRTRLYRNRQPNTINTIMTHNTSILSIHRYTRMKLSVRNIIQLFLLLLNTTSSSSSS